MAARLAFNDPLASARLADAIPTTLARQDVSIATVDDMGVLGGVLFKEWTGESFRLSAVGFDRGWLTRELLWCVFDYAFNQCGAKRVWTGTPDGNDQALRLNEHLGFKETVRVPGMYPGNRCVILRMLERSDCRWLKLKSRQFRSNMKAA